MTRWYRAYEGTVTDAKLGEAALIAGCSRSVAIAAWHCILESCATAQRGGEYDTSPRRVAVILAEPMATMEALFAAFTEIGMLGNGAVTAWKQRQFDGDTSTERVRKFRQRRGNGDETVMKQSETFQQQNETPPETETETETEREKTRARQDDPPHWKVVGTILDTRCADLDSWENDFLISIRWKPTLTKAQAESLKGIEAKMAAKGEGGSKPYALPSVTRGTPAYDAWIAYYRRQSKTGKTFYETKESFTVPTEFPPEVKAA